MRKIYSLYFKGILIIIMGIIPLTLKSETMGRLIIETRIMDTDPFSGMKSKQIIEINYKKSTKEFSFKSIFETGSTEFFGIKLNSVRDNFILSNATYSKEKREISFDIKGSTASGIRVAPDINYKFSFVYKGSGKTDSWFVKGCHDGYPAYKISFINERKNITTDIYDFKHKSFDLLKLIGSCDININIEKKYKD